METVNNTNLTLGDVLQQLNDLRKEFEEYKVESKKNSDHIIQTLAADRERRKETTKKSGTSSKRSTATKKPASNVSSSIGKITRIYIDQLHDEIKELCTKKDVKLDYLPQNSVSGRRKQLKEFLESEKASGLKPDDYNKIIEKYARLTEESKTKTAGSTKKTKSSTFEIDESAESGKEEKEQVVEEKPEKKASRKKSTNGKSAPAPAATTKAAAVKPKSGGTSKTKKYVSEESSASSQSEGDN